MRPMLLILGCGFMLCASVGAQEPKPYENLQVLPADTTREELGQAMLHNLQGLGLPRRQREGCLYCHVGSMDIPVREWDFAADDKETKAKARVMMQMVADINADYLARLEGRVDPDFEVTCATCHAGRTDPRPLHTILLQDYVANGADSTINKYDELRKRHYGAGAYDFRPYVLTQVARTAAGTGSWDDALLLANKNEAVNPGDLGASQARLTMQVSRQLYEVSIASALDFYVEARVDEADGVAGFWVLDGLGWSINRQDRLEDSLQIFRKNLELYPSDYVPNESLGDALWFSGNREAGIEVFEAWVAANPENDMGRRRLLNMREEISKAE